ncbi:hypothetical protein V1504DRAFT_464833 [Lipomyces starkeyi]
MGKVVDTELKVKGVEGLRVVDTSLLTVCAHYQVVTYAIVGSTRRIRFGRRSRPGGCGVGIRVIIGGLHIVE